MIKTCLLKVLFSGSGKMSYFGLIWQRVVKIKLYNFKDYISKQVGHMDSFLHIDYTFEFFQIKF
jgi:hypothetical protein